MEQYVHLVGVKGEIMKKVSKESYQYYSEPLTDEEIKTKLNKPFQDAGINFTERQKDILVDAFHEVERKTKCVQCGETATFEIKNIRKDDTLYFCDLHFWQFCGKMVDAYKKFGFAIKEIDKAIEGK